jgi:hypothetical protein
MLGKVEGGIGVCAHTHEENGRHTIKKPGNSTTRGRMRIRASKKMKLV